VTKISWFEKQNIVTRLHWATGNPSVAKEKKADKTLRGGEHGSEGKKNLGKELERGEKGSHEY